MRSQKEKENRIPRRNWIALKHLLDSQSEPDRKEAEKASVFATFAYYIDSTKYQGKLFEIKCTSHEFKDLRERAEELLGIKDEDPMIKLMVKMKRGNNSDSQFDFLVPFSEILDAHEIKHEASSLTVIRALENYVFVASRRDG